MEMILYRKGEAFTVLYDECDHELVSSHKWLISSDGYVVTHIGGKPTLMHRMILGTPKGFLTDHKNRVKHDNQRENLRICTKAENQRNRKNTPNKKYQGTTSISGSSKYAAQIKVNGSAIFLGGFDTEEDAARAYDRAAAFYHKDFAYLNFPDETPGEFIDPVKRRIGRKEKVEKVSDYFKRVITDDLSEVLKEKHTLKNQLLIGDIIKVAQKMGKTSNSICNWFKNDREFSKDGEYVAAIMDVISERKEMYQQMIKKAVAA